MAITPIQDTPAYQRPEAKAVTKHLDLIDDLVTGTSAMHEHALDREYIRKWESETPTVYGIRSKMATCFEGLGRVLTASIGMLFSTAPQLTAKAQAEAFAADWDNLDGTGTRGDVLLKRYANLMLKHGAAAILVDHPKAPDGVVVTEANEAALGLRPTWALYPRAAVRAWRVETIGGASVPTLWIFGETQRVPDGRFGVRDAVCYRVLQLVTLLNEAGEPVRLATWRLFEEQTEKDGSKRFVPMGAGVYKDRTGVPFDRLPVALDPALLGELPPLLGVAHANLSHFRKKTDLWFYEALCGFPQPTVIGTLATDEKTGKPQAVRFGPTVAINVQEGGDYRMTELAGTSLAQLRESLNACVAEMAAMGLSFLVRDTRAAETAEGKRIDAAAEHATLSTFGQAMEDGANQALVFHARYRGVPSEQAPTVTLQKDFSPKHIDSATISAITEMVREGFPEDEATRILVRAGLIEVRDEAETRDIGLEWRVGRLGARDAADLDNAA